MSQTPRLVVYARTVTWSLIAAAVVAAAVTVPLILSQIRLHRADTSVVDISGRQRMLSQRVAKTALAMSVAETDALRDSWRQELITTLDEWQRGFGSLRDRSRESEHSAANSAAVAHAFEGIRPHYEAMVQAGRELADGSGMPDSALVATLMRHERPFLTRMDGITKLYASEGAVRADRVSTACLALAALVVLLPVVLTGAVNEPINRLVRRMNDRQRLAEARLAAGERLAEENDRLAEEVHQRREVEEDLRESIEELELVREIAGAMSNPVLRLDAAGRIEWANDAFATLAGIEDPAGHDALSLIADEHTSKAKLRQIREAIAGGRGIRRELQFEKPGGDLVWARAELQPSGPPSRRRFILTLIDTTRRRHRVEDLKADLRQAREKVDAQGRFLSYMSHEIRTPLSAMLGYTDLIRSGELNDAELREGIENVRSSGQMLLELVNNVLDYSKLEIGEQVCPTATDVRQLIEGVVRSFRGVAGASGLRLTHEVDDAVPRGVEVDAGKLRQVLSNLLGNALKFTRKGGVRVCTSASGGSLRIAVADTGIGIPQDRLADVFEPFRQADSDTAQRFGGTGLGLPISRTLARQMGGDLGVESTPNVGTRFEVSIPLVACELEPSPAAETGGEAKPASDSQVLNSSKLAGIRVLLADDWEINREMIRLVLTRAGADVCTAADGKQAVEAAKTWQPDVILMDMLMPVMSGREAIAELQRLGTTPPIIALTAEALDGDRDRCLRLGCVDYIAKPVDFPKLKRAIVAAASNSRGPAAEHLQDLAAARDLFFDERDATLTRLDAALARQDLSRVACLAHGLRGAAAMVGLSHWAGPLETVESAAAEGDMLAIVHALQAVRESRPTPETAPC